MLLFSQKVQEVCQFRCCRSIDRFKQDRFMANLFNCWGNYSNKAQLNETAFWNYWIYVRMFWGGPRRLPQVWILWWVRIIMWRQLHLRVVNSFGLDGWLHWRCQCIQEREYEVVRGLIRFFCVCSFEFKNTK